MVRLNNALFLSGLVGLAPAQLLQCPTAEIIQDMGNGVRFRVCQNSDYQGPTDQLLWNIADVATCNTQCSKIKGCSRAVYDNIYKACHIKGSPLTWTTSTQFTAMRLDDGPAQGTVITTCPWTEITQKTSAGNTFQICPGTDWRGSSYTIIASVASNEVCNQLCEKDPKCSKSVYDINGKYCHFKDPNPTWLVDTRFNAGRLTFKALSSTTSSTTRASTTTSTTAIIKTTSTTSSAGTTTSATAVAKTTSTTSPVSTTTTTNSTPVSTPVSQLTVDSFQACPQGENTQKIGTATYKICPNTDWNGPSKSIVGNINSIAECAALCDSYYTCQKAVFDHVYKFCHIKDPDSQFVWKTDNQYDTIRIDNSSKLNPANVGKWSDMINLPLIPAAAYVVPQSPDSSRILMWSAYAAEDFGGSAGYTQFADFNFKTGSVSQRSVTNTQHDMFCPGISAMGDGRVLITGGSNADVASIYDPSTNAFTRASSMNLARGYQSSVTLSNGKVFTIGGSFAGGIFKKDGEIYDPSTNIWTSLPGADVTPMLTVDHEGAWRTDNHGWLYAWKDGSVFQAGPSRAMNWYTTTGPGGVKAAGTRDDQNDAMCGVNVMFDAVNGKIFSAGGAQDYSDSQAWARANVITIGNVNDTVSVQKLADMRNARALANIVVLPNGKILVSGGQTYARVFQDTLGVRTPEIYDPNDRTSTFKELAPEINARNYHSISLLLADGTVFSAGGGMCWVLPGNGNYGCDRSADHPNGQIFSPPYLFKADGSLATRPVINSVASAASPAGTSAKIGSVLTIKLDITNASLSLIRMGSVTHSVNTDQRRVPLTNISVSGTTYSAVLPADAGIIPPGFYYLFAVSKDGVPSIAKTIQIKL